MRQFTSSVAGRLHVVIAVVLSAALSGCGAPPPSQPKFLPVVGKVLVEDKQVKSGTVQFRADPERGNKSMDIPIGVIRADGSYELTTNERPGAPPGWYRVLVIADNFKVSEPPPSPIWPKIPEGALPKPLVNERYLYFKHTDLFVEVVESAEPEAYILKLKP